MRVLVIFAGVMGAASLAQFPEFSQQYLQRLAGKVDGLAAVTTQFDATAAANGLSRDGALRALAGSDVLEAQQADMRAAFVLQERLAGDLALLRDTTPLQRLAMPRAFGDAELRAATYADYRPAMPTTADGLICAGIGYALSAGIVSVLFSLMRRMWRGAGLRREA
jgi:Protein of unknown function (DUF2937)